MGIFGNQKDDKVTNLENEVQDRIKRIAELRAQISNLAKEESKVQSEYDVIEPRIVALWKRSEELSKMKKEEVTLSRDVEQQEEKHSSLITELNRLQDKRSQLMPKIAQLRSQVKNEEVAAEKDLEEVSRLEKTLADNIARKKKIQEDTETLKKNEEELVILEEEYKKIADNIPKIKTKYKQTKQLVEEVQKGCGPIDQALTDIWRKLPSDELDKQLDKYLEKLKTRN